ncbi:uncharacterized protein ARMOST_11565 [Armillaria ostoyae]|uniref:Uncharacterized protein n=1 Tax=Armillaria ostoyae TaxID=47428 RepID=A0A284RHH2_ARMOS|nr:uncharacterized protein ARMOST_11565 [Armillaria ostoyae]
MSLDFINVKRPIYIYKRLRGFAHANQDSSEAVLAAFLSDGVPKPNEELLNKLSAGKSIKAAYPRGAFEELDRKVEPGGGKKLNRAVHAAGYMCNPKRHIMPTVIALCTCEEECPDSVPFCSLIERLGSLSLVYETSSR